MACRSYITVPIAWLYPGRDKLGLRSFGVASRARTLRATVCKKEPESQGGSEPEKMKTMRNKLTLQFNQPWLYPMGEKVVAAVVVA